MGVFLTLSNKWTYWGSWVIHWCRWVLVHSAYIPVQITTIGADNKRRSVQITNDDHRRRSTTQHGI